MTFQNLASLFDLQSTDLGTTPWRTIAKADVEVFADLTGDHQWIHLDEAKAKQDSPYGQTIVHGALILALAPVFVGQLLQINNVRHIVNAGMDRVRFRQPVPVGANIRGAARLREVEDFSGNALATVALNIEIEGQRRLACSCEQRMIIHA